MTIFFIYGEKDAGKTTTCKKILDWLNTHGWHQLSFDKIQNPAEGWLNDFKAKGIFNNKTIAIYSPGDDRAHVRNAVSFAQETPVCDILIATIRKGIHYRQVTTPLNASPQYSVHREVLDKHNNNSDKAKAEDCLVNKLTSVF